MLLRTGVRQRRTPCQPRGGPRGRLTSVARSAPAGWVPQRQHVMWIDSNPQAGNEMRDLHPMLVLSSGAFNERTGLVIGLPTTTATYNATNPFALPLWGGGRRAAQQDQLCAVPSAEVFRLACTRRAAAPQGAVGRRPVCPGLRGAEPDRHARSLSGLRRSGRPGLAVGSRSPRGRLAEGSRRCGMMSPGRAQTRLTRSSSARPA